MAWGVPLNSPLFKVRHYKRTITMKLLLEILGVILNWIGTALRIDILLDLDQRFIYVRFQMG